MEAPAAPGGGRRGGGGGRGAGGGRGGGAVRLTSGVYTLKLSLGSDVATGALELKEDPILKQ
jgi:hypothetical protein